MADPLAVAAWATPLAPLLVAALIVACRSPQAADRVGRWLGAIAAAPALVVCTYGVAIGDGAARTGSWWILDGRGAVFLLAIAGVGAASVWMSPTFLRITPTSRAGALGARRVYWTALLLFWAVLLALPLAGNLALAWVVAEATTAASAVLVAFTGNRVALEAGWKYLAITSVGLTVALAGIVLLYAAAAGGGGFGALDWHTLRQGAAGMDHATALAALALIVTGLAAKAGWAPVHNWLPDAHSQAPAPVSALLSGALLPAVALVAWRLGDATAPAVGERAVTTLFIGFGLASLAVAVPFLWRPMPFKRLLAYSSLEHMGVVILAIGIDHPLATAGALVHVLGHAVLKGLGFMAAVPLLRYQPAAGRRPPRGLAAQSPPLALAVGVSVGGLAGLPPSPLFLSVVLVLAGAVAAGLVWVAAAAAVLMALGFLGLAHVLVEGIAGRPSGRRPRGARSVREIAGLTAVCLVALTVIVIAALGLPGSDLVQTATGAG
ncbi:MAG: proton-conducting transporter membrane subunit [Thermoleophilia bacterium]